MYDTIVKIIKDNHTIACFLGYCKAYDNFLPDVLIELLGCIDLSSADFTAPKGLSHLEQVDEEIIDEFLTSTIDLDKGIVRVSRSVFTFVRPEEVNDENEFYSVERNGDDFILNKLAPYKGEKARLTMKPFEMDFLEEKMAHEFPLDEAEEILSSMSEDAWSLEGPTLLQNGLVYVPNLI